MGQRYLLTQKVMPAGLVAGIRWKFPLFSFPLCEVSVFSIYHCLHHPRFGILSFYSIYFLTLEYNICIAVLSWPVFTYTRSLLVAIRSHQKLNDGYATLFFLFSAMYMILSFCCRLEISRVVLRLVCISRRTSYCHMCWFVSCNHVFVNDKLFWVILYHQDIWRFATHSWSDYWTTFMYVDFQNFLYIWEGQILNVGWYISKSITWSINGGGTVLEIGRLSS